MDGSEIILENTIKIEPEIKQEQYDSHDDSGEEHFLGNFPGQSQCTGLCVSEEKESEEEELKPPVAVWLKEEVEDCLGDEEELHGLIDEADCDAQLGAKKTEDGLFSHAGSGNEGCGSENQMLVQSSPGDATAQLGSSDARQFTCSDCNMSFIQQALVDSHIKEKHMEEIHVCSFCEKCFKEKSRLVVHLLTHTGYKQYECSECEKKCSDKRSLNIHMRIHTGKKPFACSVCEKSFLHKCNLDRHIKTHLGEKFICSVCEKSFSSKGSLATHIRMHNDEKQYACTMCGKTFSQKSNLVKHMQSHTGEKPYACSMCEKRYLEK